MHTRNDGAAGPERSPRHWIGTALLVLATTVLALIVLGLAPFGDGARARQTRSAHAGQTDYGPYDVNGTGQINPKVQADIDRLTGGRLTTVHFYSRALRREADYLVFLPAGYTSSRPLPVFYLLHGMPGTPMGFTLNARIEVTLQHLIASHRIKPMILVFPDGRIDGREQSDSEWANTPTGDYESYVVNVVQDVDRRFATLPCRQERALAGLSAGAYGAANVGLHQDSTFGLVQVWSGYFIETHSGVFAQASHQDLAYNSPLDYVRTMGSTLRRYPLRVFLYVGRADPYARQIRSMATALQRAGAQETWAIYPGSHNWKTWAPHVPQMLEMASRDFATPLQGTAMCGS